LSATHKELVFPPYRFEVTELAIIRSELSSKASRYTEISHHSCKTN
jgi:hypothetical protein